MKQDYFNHIGVSDEHEARRVSLKLEGKGEHNSVYWRYHHNRLMKAHGVNGSNFIKDKDLFLQSLEGHENADEIMKELSRNIDLEENGFRNVSEVEHEGVTASHVSSSDRDKTRKDEGDMLETLSLLWDEPNGTNAVMSHLQFYLGESRAWRDGWNASSFKRHVKRCENARKANGEVWGEFSLIEEGQAIIKRLQDNKLNAQARIEHRQARQAAKRAKRFSQMVKAGRV